MRVRSITRWHTATGQRRRIRLYGSWENMIGRWSGRLHAGNGARPWKGIELGFTGWAHFRAWALAAGYSRARCSLDRINQAQGYTPENCRWVTVSQNTIWQNFNRRKRDGLRN